MLIIHFSKLINYYNVILVYYILKEVKISIICTENR